MIRIFSLFILISLATAYSVFAAEADNDTLGAPSSVAPSGVIDPKEIAQTMRDLNDLITQAHAGPQNNEAFDQTRLQRNTDSILNSDEDSEDSDD